MRLTKDRRPDQHSTCVAMERVLMQGLPRRRDVSYRK